ncbi:hypothetical protein I4F81_011707 [Pyropia yezoensis]|uniref:Uncharacterized protein n=1 Tax=Pyropia yezoensis TaxID=2788 RepID=A0ACC3CHH4_PYRYE|nr:hypothetical protein I4F81_011707 [Neopyropia yezoensis]
MFASLAAHSPDAADGTRDRVVLVTPDVSTAARASLAADGIRTVNASVVRSPYTDNDKYNPRFDAVLTKLRVWTLVQYRRVLLLDGDVLISGDMAPLFGCGTFCAAFLNPCHFNSGVVLLTPSIDTYDRMQEALPRMDSYDSGDQGFLNSGGWGGGGGLPLGGGALLVAVPPRAFLLVSTGLAAAEWAVTSLVAAVAVPPALPPVPAAALLVAAKFALAAAALAAHGHWFCASRLVWAKMAAAAFLTSAYLAVVLVLHGRVALLWVRAAEAVAAPADGGGGGGDDP